MPVPFCSGIIKYKRLVIMSVRKCVYTPPADQKIQPYLTILINIINDMNTGTNGKETTLARIQNLKESIEYVINRAK